MKAFDKLPMKKKIQQIVKELLTASKMHKNQADKLKSVVDEIFGSKKSVLKGRSFPIGTIRTHGGVKKKKTAQGWVPVAVGRPTAKPEDDHEGSSAGPEVVSTDGIEDWKGLMNEVGRVLRGEARGAISEMKGARTRAEKEELAEDARTLLIDSRLAGKLAGKKSVTLKDAIAARDLAEEASLVLRDAPGGENSTKKWSEKTKKERAATRNASRLEFLRHDLSKEIKKQKMGKSQELEMNKTDRMTLFDAVQVAKAMDANGGADAPSKMSPKYDGDDMKAGKKKKKKKKKKMRNWKVPGEVPA